MILTLNILLALIVTIGIVGLLAYNIRPLRRPLRLDDLHVARSRDAHPYAARRSHEPVARTLDSARA